MKKKMMEWTKEWTSAGQRMPADGFRLSSPAEANLILVPVIVE